MLRLDIYVVAIVSLVAAYEAVVPWKEQIQSSPNKPNLLFIITDQQRYDTIRRTQEELNHPESARISTPNLDKLAREGAYFRNAYSHCAVCAPARTSLLTGCTIENTGIRNNWVVQNLFRPGNDAGVKIPLLRTYDEILVEDFGYVAEYYGKWHSPLIKGYVYDNDVRDVAGREAWFGKYESDNITKHMSVSKGPYYRKWLEENKINNTVPEQGQQLGPSTHRTYVMDPLDERYLDPPDPSLGGVREPDCHGMDLIPDGFSITAHHGLEALEAMERLYSSGKPFSLTISFNYPHPPMVPTKKYYDMYDPENMIPPESKDDYMSNSAYKNKKMNEQPAYFNKTNLQRWKANYYGLITEIDEWIGRLMKKIETLGIDDNTLVLFTSDHGEMLGSHGMRSKNTFYEESNHIPLILWMPKFIERGVAVDEPVSHLDIHSTVLDYLGVPGQYKSDGSSLRRLIEGTDKDDSFVVTMWNNTDSTWDGRPTRLPAFMIRKGDWKLIISSIASLPVIDMLYNLKDDPHELNNLVGLNGMTADEAVIGKAEHLKALLVKHLAEVDSPAADEVRNRRKWRLLDFWVGDTTLEFRNVLPDSTRSEWLYIGSTTGSENVQITDISIEDDDSASFGVDWTQGEIPLNGERVLTLTYTVPDERTGQPSATLVIKHNAGGGDRIVNLIGPVVPHTWTSIAPSGAPSAMPVRSAYPSYQPSAAPSSDPSSAPSADSSDEPSAAANSGPRAGPNVDHNRGPSSAPSADPNEEPSLGPSSDASTRQSLAASTKPSADPSFWHSSSFSPTSVPSVGVGSSVSVAPSSAPSAGSSSWAVLSPFVLFAIFSMHVFAAVDFLWL